jgi:phage gp46-like protein
MKAAVAYEVIVDHEDGSRQWLLVRESSTLRAISRAMDHAGDAVKYKIGASFSECPESAARVVIAWEVAGGLECA